MGQDVLVKVDHVSKKFCRSLRRSLWYGLCDIAAEFNPARNGLKGRATVAQPGTQLAAGEMPGIKSESNLAAEDYSDIRPGEFWAVRNVSFQLRRGECLGLIGRNGAGKTTLLKMLNGLIKPDAGRIEMRGRVAAMIALGAGFNPILSGRENIYVAGSLRGLSKREIDARLEEIVEFSEIGDSIDAPVQSYSSGMQVRLGFSVAVSLKPDILLIDEVLAVGDAGFKRKAYNKITKTIENAAVIFVSHSIVQLAKVCNRGMLLRNGMVCALSDQMEVVIDEYFREFPFGHIGVGGSGKARLLAIEIEADGRRVHSSDLQMGLSEKASHDLIFKHGRPLAFELAFDVAPEIKRMHLEIKFSDMEMRSIAQSSSVNSDHAFVNNSPSTTRIRLSLPELLLNKGRYAINIALMEEHACGLKIGEILCSYDNVAELQVSADSVLFGAAPVQLRGNWEQPSPDAQ